MRKDEKSRKDKGCDNDCGRDERRESNMVKKGNDRECGDRERSERKDKFVAYSRHLGNRYTSLIRRVTNGKDPKRSSIRTGTRLSGVIFMEIMAT